MKKHKFAKRITLLLCCLLLANRFPAYAGWQETFPGWQQDWGWHSMADWLLEDIGQSPWNPSAAGLLKRILHIGWAAVEDGAAVLLEESMTEKAAEPKVEEPKPAKTVQATPSDAIPARRELSLSIHKLPRVGSDRNGSDRAEGFRNLIEKP